MAERPVLVFDSGLGGLSVLREIREHLPRQGLRYIADDAAFPYGDWREAALRAHLLALFSKLLAWHDPALVVVACNTAATLALADLRAAYPQVAFVGTVPAIKPAAERTRSGVIALLATPATIGRDYTRALIRRFAADCIVQPVASRTLAGLAEAACHGQAPSDAAVRAEIAACFITSTGRRTDIVVLACTHYPLLADVFRRVAPWPVEWLDPAPAIARRVQALQADRSPQTAQPRRAPGIADRAFFTSGPASADSRRLLVQYGLTC